MSFGQKIELEGTYQGKNIYVQNPADATGAFNCTEKILVNGKEVSFKSTSAYEIRLDSLGLKIGDSIIIEIFHKPNCKPKVLNDNSSPKITFEIVSISVDSAAVLHWTSKNEIGKFTFKIEQYRWNKWVKIAEVDGIGGMQENAYSFQTKPHSGKNKFRVKQVASGNPRISQTVDFESPELGIKILGNQNKLSDKIEFNKETMYELYDRGGNIIKKGDGKTIDLKGLERHFYYLNYDNKTEQVTKFY
ncbi:MAG TPA: hypothetical protein VJI69_04475 [Bacteroidia bacterium]|nr:hypothetical protein [Bacteroidia bacterium]